MIKPLAVDTDGQHWLLLQVYFQLTKRSIMPFKKFAIVAIALLTIVISACNNSKDKVTVNSTFSFKIDNVTYQSSSTSAYLTDTLYAGKKTLIIDGVTNNFKNHMELMVTFPDAISTGSYTQMVEMSLMDVEKKTTGYVEKLVTVKITSINSKYAEGTFSGVVINGEIEKPLTDGTFKVEIY